MNNDSLYYLGVSFICLFFLLLVVEEDTHFPKNKIAEPFETLAKRNKQDKIDKQCIVYCVGDSMLNNARYVDANESVLANLTKDNNTNTTGTGTGTGTNTNFKFKMLAKDGARITDAFSQMDTINGDINGICHCIVLSAGGNDLLAEDGEPREIFQQFLDLVKSIHIKFGDAITLIVLGLYYPPQKPRFHDRIKQWNVWLDEYKSSKEYKMNVIQTADFITDADDICYKIEPSAQGGQKIAHHIMLELTNV